MLKPFNLPFAEFARQAKPSGAVNRVAAVGSAEDVLSFSVYLNGEVVRDLPIESVEFEFTEARVHRVAVMVGLKEVSFRDSLRVAELMAIRSAWMSAVLEASTLSLNGVVGGVLSDSAVNDFGTLSDGFGHPWIMNQVELQMMAAESLSGVFKATEGAAAGRSLADQIPEEITRGVIVAQNPDFTVQATGDGVVAHENKRLGSLPSVGQDVSVLYYRGNGQVFENSLSLVVSSPFLDPRSGDLAVSVSDEKNELNKVVLFNGLASLSRFVEQQGLNKSLVAQAVDLKVAEQKKNPPRMPVPPDGAQAVSSGRYVGVVQAVSPAWVIQSSSPSVLVAHKLSDFNLPPKVGEVLDVQYGRHGKAQVVVPRGLEGARGGVGRV